MHHYLNIVLAFITQHAWLAYGAIFLVSFSESLALVGLLMPGTVIMFGVGAVVATDSLGLFPVLVMAMTGAVAGAVSTRLAVVVFILVASIWGFIWGGRRVVSLFARKAPLWISNLKQWASTEPSSHRTAWGDSVFIAITELGDSFVNLSLSGAWRWGLFSGVLFISFVIGFSRLYLGAHWLSDVLGGYFIGTSWTAFMGIAWLKAADEKVPNRLLSRIRAGGIHSR